MSSTSDYFNWLKIEAIKQRIINQARGLLPPMYKSWNIRFANEGENLLQYHKFFSTYLPADNAMLSAYAHHSLPGVVVIQLRYASQYMLEQHP